MDIFTLLSKIWGFFVIILMILISERLHRFFVVKRLERNLENIKTNQQALLHDLKNSTFTVEDSTQTINELSNCLGLNIKINKIELYRIDSKN